MPVVSAAAVHGTQQAVWYARPAVAAAPLLHHTAPLTVPLPPLPALTPPAAPHAPPTSPIPPAAGSLPAELGQLSALQSLVLHTNQLERAIPKELGQCERLTVLQLQRNRLTGALSAAVPCTMSIPCQYCTASPLHCQPTTLPARARQLGSRSPELRDGLAVAVVHSRCKM
jgi:hypothetical protein